MSLKIAVFRALQLGDLLNTIPAIRALRGAYPDAEITLLGLPWAKEFVQRFDKYFDRFIHFPGYPGLPEQEYDPIAFASFLERMHVEQFDLLLQMQGNGTIVNELLQRFGARRIAGFHNKECRMNKLWFIDYPESIHEIRRHQALMIHLGIPLAGDHLEFPIKKKDREDFDKLYLSLKPGRYVCIHPGSRGAWRQWPPAYFALLGDQCAQKGLDLVITGTGNEVDITREVLKRLHYPAIDLTGYTSLGALAILIGDAALLIANCTGVSHLAAALDTPSLIISMDGEPHRWATLDRELHYTLDWLDKPSLDNVLHSFDKLMVSRRLQPAD